MLHLYERAAAVPMRTVATSRREALRRQSGPERRIFQRVRGDGGKRAGDTLLKSRHFATKHQYLRFCARPLGDFSSLCVSNRNRTTQSVNCKFILGFDQHTTRFNNAFDAFLQRNRVVKALSCSWRNPQTLEIIVNECERWQDRFSGQDYASGKEPKYFLKSCKQLLPRSGRALAVADGEGRNGVWLAE
jgi:hypothetical protein